MPNTPTCPYCITPYKSSAKDTGGKLVLRILADFLELYLTSLQRSTVIGCNLTPMNVRLL
jgi:hypothetical protein